MEPEKRMWLCFGYWVPVEVIDSRDNMVLVRRKCFRPIWVEESMTRILTEEEKVSNV